jgi:uncharacterized membrane protein
MNKSISIVSGTSLLASSLLGALALAATTANAGPAAQPNNSEKCYGVAKAGHNDCAAGAHSCAGQSTRSMDKSSFVYLPAGACQKLAGGSLTPR